jgi:membrane associated rhomboid family serine protease
MNTPHQEVESQAKIEAKEQLEDLKLKIGKIFSNIPLFIKCYFIITIVFYILNLKLTFISYYLINVPAFTILRFQIWRLITSVFITTNILQIILAFFVWVKYASLLETSLGTIKYTLIFLVNTFCIQVLNIIIYPFFSLVYKKSFNSEIKSKKNSGLWGIVMCEMTLLCVSNPESPMKLLLIPYTVKAKIYPIILVLMFILVNYLEIDVEVISGVIYGFIYFYYLKTKLQISDTFVQKLETNNGFKWLSNFKGFISVTHISSGMPISIIKVSSIDNEQEKLKGKGVVVAGSVYAKKEEENLENENEEVTVETTKIDSDVQN